MNECILCSSLKLLAEVVKIVTVLLVTHENKSPVSVLLFLSQKGKIFLSTETSESVALK
jgi:hypothetical protein